MQLATEKLSVGRNETGTELIRQEAMCTAGKPQMKGSGSREVKTTFTQGIRKAPWTRSRAVSGERSARGGRFFTSTTTHSSGGSYSHMRKTLLQTELTSNHQGPCLVHTSKLVHLSLVTVCKPTPKDLQQPLLISMVPPRQEQGCYDFTVHLGPHQGAEL